jgi:hypothetical protein
VEHDEGAYEDYLDELANQGHSRPPDPIEGQAVDEVRAFFEENRERVYSSRQIEVHFERRYFHWITHRALHVLAAEGTIKLQQQQLITGTAINFVWHRSNRYVRRQVAEVKALVERYSHSDFTIALGNTGELLVSDGLGRFQFVQRGRETQEYAGRRWTRTNHNLDFVFERDGRAYGVEVKNTLAYINDGELGVKLELCAHLGLLPLFVMRMAPAPFIQRIVNQGGFALILGHHLYPLSHRALAREINEKLGLPADAPRALYDGTIQRFVSWHERQVAAGAPMPTPLTQGSRRRSARGPIPDWVREARRLSGEEPQEPSKTEENEGGNEGEKV